MIEKLKDLEQEALDNLTPEEYEAISEDDSTMSYTVEMEDIFPEDDIEDEH